MLLYCWKGTEDLGVLPRKHISSLFSSQTNSPFYYQNKSAISSGPHTASQILTLGFPSIQKALEPLGVLVLSLALSRSHSCTHPSRLALTYPLAWWGQQGAPWAAERTEAPAVSSSALPAALAFGPASCWCCWHCPLGSEAPEAPGAVAGPGTTQT